MPSVVYFPQHIISPEEPMRHFLSLADLSPQQLQQLLQKAVELKEEWKQGGNRPVLAGKSLGMLFQKPSLRTRVSFEMGMVHLGGYAFYLSPLEIQLGKRESVPDVARVLSRYVDIIMARVFAHDHITTLAEYSSVPVINGLSDYNHPCQGLSDLLTIVEKKGQNLRGLKLTFVGDGNNVATSLLFGAAKVGMDFTISGPPGYELPDEVWARGQAFASESGSRIAAVTDPAEAVRDADVIYTDVWASMGQEDEAAERARVFRPYQVNTDLVSHAKPDAIVMHCLPAHRGEEITDEVCDGPHSVLWDQAENRMHAQKAILVDLLTV
jgi:ornithine carbamoyltransferase